VSESAEVDVGALLGRFQRAAATIAVAESLTGGLVTAALTNVAGASATVRGGLVVYATDLKATLADVPQRLLAERGPVDRDVAVALARGARARLRATVGVGVTGVAGPTLRTAWPWEPCSWLSAGPMARRWPSGSSKAAGRDPRAGRRSGATAARAGILGYRCALTSVSA
jgi:nicotinamide-nucleotide amidase